MRIVGLGSLAAAFLCGSTLLHADTIVLTGGAVVTAEDDATSTVSGPGLEVDLTTFGGFPRFVSDGASVDFSGLLQLVTGPPFVGNAVVNGEMFAGISTGGSIEISAVPVLVGATMAAPFSLKGTITGHRADLQEILFSVDVVGSGTLSSSALLQSGFPSPTYRVSGATFRIEPRTTPAPTPEPMTLLLLGTGLVATVASRKMRRRG